MDYRIFIALGVFVAWVALAGLPCLGTARRAGRLSFWWATAGAMTVLPLVTAMALYSLYRADVFSGPHFAIGLIPSGALIFGAGFLAGDDHRAWIAVGLRALGWSMMLAPMLISLVLFVLLPAPMMLAFLVHTRWSEPRSEAVYAVRS